MTQQNQSTENTTPMAKTTEDGSLTPSSTQSPPTQLMEKSDDSSQKSRAFSRTKSTSPGEWSTVSDESLFSIHTDSKSFMLRSGELGINGEQSSPCHVFSFTYSSRFDKGTEDNVAVETVKEVVKESDGGLTEEKLATLPGHKPHHHPRQTGGTSTASFAFPVLTGGFEKDTSTRFNSPVSVEPEKTQAEAPPNTRSKIEASPKSDSEISKEHPNASLCSWFLCFPCCRSSS